VASKLVSKIDSLLTLVLDGGWHDREAIATAMEIEPHQFRSVIRLLSDFGFIQTKDHEICIDPDTKLLLASLSRDSKKRKNDSLL
jgi:hypothetical protein